MWDEYDKMLQHSPQDDQKYNLEQARDLAKQRNLFEIDATCGLVTKIHSAVKRYSKKGYKIILLNDDQYVEVKNNHYQIVDITKD